MKKLFKSILAIMSVCLLFVSCTDYNDAQLWKEIEDIKSEIAEMNKSVNSLKTIVDALKNSKLITNVKETPKGYEITFNDGKDPIVVNHGKDAPVISIKEDDGVFYWTLTLDGKTDYLYDNQTPKQRIPVSGKDGESPKISVDADGFWLVDGVRIKDASGNEVPAKGKDGDSFFKNIEETDDAVIFTLADDTKITIPKAIKGKFAIVVPEAEIDSLFASKETREYDLELPEVKMVVVISKPNGWNASVDLAAKKLKVTAPYSGRPDFYNEGLSGNIVVAAMDENGSTLMAAMDVGTLGYASLDGTYVVFEGNMSNANGTIVYYDIEHNEYRNIYEKANDDKQIGNVVQDIYIHNKRIYILTQNGDALGGEGRFVVCNANDMTKIYADPLAFNTSDGVLAWPQHLVVVNDSVAYVQYSSSDNEVNSGICRLSLSDSSVTVKETIEGTYGAFTTVGAIKTRLVYSRGKIYAGCGHSVVIIDPNTASITKRIPFEGHQVKGIVKAADNNIYIALAGTYTGTHPNMGTLVSDPKVVTMDHDGSIVKEQELTGIKLPIASWTPAINMCASFTRPYLYFVDTDEFYFNTASRYNYKGASLGMSLYKNYLKGNDPIYGIMGEHPTTKELWVGKSTNSYTASEIYVYRANAQGQPKEILKFSYPVASPAGVDFPYRFTNEFINR